MRFGIHGVCLDLGWSKMDLHIRDGLPSRFSALVGCLLGVTPPSSRAVPCLMSQRVILCMWPSWGCFAMYWVG